MHHEETFHHWTPIISITMLENENNHRSTKAETYEATVYIRGKIYLPIFLPAIMLLIFI